MITERNLELKYRQTSTELLGKEILRRDENSEYAAYYLIRFRMQQQLQSVYNSMPIDEEYSDILMDFFLFLRDGKGGRNQVSFQAFEGLRSMASLEPWVVNTFKNFLADRMTELLRRKTNEEAAMAEPKPTYDYHRDSQIRCMAILFAKVRQMFVPREQFIYYRSLLNALGKERTISNEQVAEAMGLTYANYRQISTRTKQQALCTLAKIQESPSIPLSDEEQRIVDRVNSDFENLFDVIAELYEAALNDLACKPAIEALRIQAGTANGPSDWMYDIEEDDDICCSLKDKDNSSFNEDLFNRLLEEMKTTK